MEWPKYVLDKMPKRIQESSYEARAEWVAEFRRKKAALARKWISENREEANAAKREWRAKNRGKHRKEYRDWLAKNPEKAKAAKEAWTAKNPVPVARYNVKQALKRTGISDPPPELVELFTQLRLAKRELKKGTKP